MSNEADFFVAGGTLRTSAPSYVTRPADAELLQHLQAGEFCYVLTPRQMGKSSLMVRTAQRLRAEGIRVVIIDLTSIGASSSAISADQWYLGLLSRMRSDLRLATDVQDWWQAHSAFSVSQRFIDFLQQVVLTECADKVVILIDEIDSTLNLPFRDDFFAAIRAIYNERAHNPIYSRLTFALFGVATPTDLIQDRERTPFNVGQRIDLREFTLADAEPLRQGLANRLPEQANAIFQHIFYWTNGHPYLTQKLCHAVVLHTDGWQEESIEQAVDQLVHMAFLSEEGRKDPNLTFVQDRILTSLEQERRQMLRLYQRVRNNERVADDDRSLIQNRLELYGLVGVAQGMLQVRNRIYEQVFTSSWVDSMIPVNRQQRIAVMASALALVLLIGVIAILNLNPNPTCDELSTIFTQNVNDSNTRLGALDGLFRQGDTCRTTALDLFYSIETQEQLALFDGLRDLPTERERLNNVIGNIYLTLDTEPAHDHALMDRWLSVLRNAGFPENDTLVKSIHYWKIGRQAFQERKFQDAVLAYDYAIAVRENENHLVLHYDLALALIETNEYDEALKELGEVVRMAQIMPSTTLSPTPTSLSTPSLRVSPISISTPVTPMEAMAPGRNNTPILAIRVSRTVIQPTVTNNSQEGESLAPLTPTAIPIVYLRRFHNADDIRRNVKEKIQENSALLVYWQKNSKDYQSLIDLGFDVAIAFTQTPTTASNLTPTPIFTLTLTATPLNPQDVVKALDTLGLFLPTLSNVAHPSIAVDSAGGIHLAFEPVSPAASGGLLVQYAYCAADCLRRESWQIIAVGEASVNWAGVRLALTTTGKPRLLWFSQSNWREDGHYLFAGCDRACTQPANWRSVAVATASIGSGEGDYFALDADGNPHFLYTSIQSDHTGTFHTYCLAACLAAPNWREEQVSDNYLLGSFSLAFDAQNRLRLALSAEENRQSALVYVTCEAQCISVANWQVIALIGLGSESDLSLRLDAAGRPRLAVYTGHSGIQGEEKRLHYFQCNNECHLFTSWTRNNVGLAEGEGGNLALLLDGQSRPHLVVVDSDFLPKQLSYVYCSNRCDTSNPVWQRRAIEDGETVSARLCSVGYAYIGRRPVLAWHNANSLLVAHGVENRCLGDDTATHLVRLTAIE